MYNQYVEDTKFIGLDIETTGLSPYHDNIIEVAVTVQNSKGEELDSFETLINPQREISDKITEITSITEDMLQGAPLIAKVLPELFSYLQSGVVVAHNAPFDMGFIVSEAKRCGYAVPDMCILDTLTMSRVIFSEYRRHGLQHLATELQLPQDSAHRALSDARLCMRLFSRMMGRIEDENPMFFPSLTVEELLKRSKTTVTSDTLRSIYGA